MKHIFTLLVLVSTFNIFAQEKLSFDKRFVQSEDKWIAFEPDSLNSYHFGFIYIDSQAGLTLNYEGSFTIDNNGKFILKKRDAETSIKYRLEANNTLVAFIPESKFSELNIKKTPDWLKPYKEDENSIERLYNWGYRYNGWNECEKALEFLEKAKKINPNHKGLRVELAFSYNCLKRYQDAINILEDAIKSEPLDAYVNKELIYAQVKIGKLKEAENTCKKVVRDCPDKTYNAENAYNILQAYYLKKEVEKFKNWLAESSSYLLSEERFKNLVEKMKTELKI